MNEVLRPDAAPALALVQWRGALGVESATAGADGEATLRVADAG